MPMLLQLPKHTPGKLTLAGLLLWSGVSGCKSANYQWCRDWCGHSRGVPDYHAAPVVPEGGHIEYPAPAPGPQPPQVPPADNPSPYNLNPFHPKTTPAPVPAPPVRQGPGLQPGLSPDGFEFEEPVETGRKSTSEKLGQIPKLHLKYLGNKVAAVMHPRSNATAAPVATYAPTVSTAHPADGTQPVSLTSPPEIYQFPDSQTPQQMPPASAHDTSRAPQQASPPAPLDLSASVPAMSTSSGLNFIPQTATTRTPPQYSAYQHTRYQADQTFAIPRMSLCREVRSYEDVIEIDAQRLQPGQDLLIYATLENFRSQAASDGHRTQTHSTLEVRSASGAVLAKQSLGTAADLARSPRRDYFLTHRVTIPRELPPGEYVFTLYVFDLVGSQSARSDLAVRVTAGQSLPDETGGTAGSATSPGSYR